jgi:hypothetical protein
MRSLTVLERFLFFFLSAQSKPGETLGRRATGLTVNGFNVRRAAREYFWRLFMFWSKKEYAMFNKYFPFFMYHCKL